MMPFLSTIMQSIDTLASRVEILQYIKVPSVLERKLIKYLFMFRIKLLYNPVSIEFL